MHLKRELFAWAAAAVLFIGGDVITPAWGLRIGHTEAHPVAAGLMAQIGVIPAMLLGKVVVMAIAITFSFAPRIRPDVYRSAIPFGVAAVGLLITTWNLAVIT